MKYTVKNGDKFIYQDTADKIVDNYRNGIETFIIDDRWVAIRCVIKTDIETIIEIEVAR